MSVRLAIRASEEESTDYLLVYWPEEDLVSAVCRTSVIEPDNLAYKTACKIKVGRKVYPGIIADIGSKRRIQKLEDEYIEGSYEIPSDLKENQHEKNPPKRVPFTEVNKSSSKKAQKRTVKESLQNSKKKRNQVDKSGKILFVSKHGGQASEDTPSQCTETDENIPPNNDWTIDDIYHSDYEDVLDLTISQPATNEDLMHTQPRDQRELMETLHMLIDAVEGLRSEINCYHQQMSMEMKEVKDTIEDHLAKCTCRNCAPVTLGSSNVPPTVNFDNITLTSNTDSSLPMPIMPSKGIELPSTEVDKQKLKSVEEVLQNYKHLRFESKISLLTIKLAREAYFGDDVLKRCTPRGWQNLPALPHQELHELKMKVFHLFPTYWAKPECFEKTWMTAQEALAQTCKRLRKKDTNLS